MLRNLIDSVGGRGFLFAVMGFWITAGFVWLGDLTWDQWLDYNKVIGLTMLGAKAIEGGAKELAKKTGGGP